MHREAMRVAQRTQLRNSRRYPSDSSIKQNRTPLVPVGDVGVRKPFKAARKSTQSKATAKPLSAQVTASILRGSSCRARGAARTYGRARWDLQTSTCRGKLII